jgi:BirA family transcriptional regulator, biotin operon repressor / biotin---[acetyl-CoA-carboxylase] ligase
MSRPFDAARFTARIGELPLGRPLLLTPATGSTNDDALAAAREGAPHGALFVTEEQRRGRGRRGNTWHSGPGEALLFSLVLRPSLSVERASSLALVAGLAVRAAVANALREAGVRAEPTVKWPNDVLVAGRKLAGVLVESHVRGETLGAVVVGVGLNVGRLSLPDEVAAHASSLLLLGATPAREDLLADVLKELDVRLQGLGSKEIPLANLVAELREFDALRGTRVRVGALEGAAIGIDAVGNLELLDAAGVTHKVTSGHVSIVSESPGPKN